MGYTKALQLVFKTMVTPQRIVQWTKLLGLHPKTPKLHQKLSIVAKSCPTLCDPRDCYPKGSFIHEIFLARILEWVVISSFRGSS